MPSPIVPANLSLIERIDAYLDQAPRSGADAIQQGPFTLFVGKADGWRYYARPLRPGQRDFTAEDVQLLRAKQRAIDVPETIEAIVEIAPSLPAACAADGLRVESLPVLVHHESVAVAVPDGIRVRRLDADDPAIKAHSVVAQLGFSSPGTAPADVGATQRDEALDLRDNKLDDFLRSRVSNAQTVVVVAEDEHGVLATGAHNPVGDATEIVGVATLPSARRRGLGAVVTNTLVADALRRGISLVLLSAGSDEVARVYERVGFRRVATALAAEPNE
ncbi:MAG TPA: GNAT family N-acetyltransferase [Actinomycetes bacterium]|nr:GNAT family N-acetyltransferase [Actinomycetes bacterium]